MKKDCRAIVRQTRDSMMNEVYLEGRKERIINDTSACFDKVKK